MEKNLTKYVTTEEAAEGKYLTPQIILGMAEKNQIPFFNDKGVIKVFPGDVAQAISEMFGVEEKKRKKKETIEPPSEETSEMVP